MKILITGTNGFIGSALLKRVFDLFGPENVVVISSNVNTRCNTITYDSKSMIFEGKFEILDDVEVLIHAGAFTPKNGSEVNDIYNCNRNIIFTEKLLQLGFRKLKKIIYLSTLDVYKSDVVISERTAIDPGSLYGLSKYYCERMIDLFSKKMGIDSLILRVGHVYGPGEEKYEKFLPKTIRSIIQNNEVELWGDGSDLRSFIYIDDVIEAITNATKTIESYSIINVVGGHSITLNELIEKLMAIRGKSVAIKMRPSNIPKRDLVFDNSLLKKTLLSNETDLIVGLKKEFDYFENLL